MRPAFGRSRAPQGWSGQVLTSVSIRCPQLKHYQRRRSCRSIVLATGENPSQRQVEKSLPPRLARVASAVGDAARVADVACDHGLLALALLERPGCERVVATDIKQAALEGALNNARAAGLREYPRAGEGTVFVRGDGRELAVRAGDGLRALRAGEVTALALCGVGTLTSLDILSGSPLRTPGEALREKGVRELVLQPGPSPRPAALRELRRFLHRAGFAPTAEWCDVFAGRHYVTLACRLCPGALGMDAPASDEALLLGQLLQRVTAGSASKTEVGALAGYLQLHLEWAEADYERVARWGRAAGGSRRGGRRRGESNTWCETLGIADVAVLREALQCVQRYAQE